MTLRNRLTKLQLKALWKATEVAIEGMTRESILELAATIEQQMAESPEYASEITALFRREVEKSGLKKDY